MFGKPCLSFSFCKVELRRPPSQWRLKMLGKVKNNGSSVWIWGGSPGTACPRGDRSHYPTSSYWSHLLDEGKITNTVDLLRQRVANSRAKKERQKLWATRDLPDSSAPPVSWMSARAWEMGTLPCLRDVWGTSAGEDVEKLEPLNSVGGNVKRSRCCGKQFDNSSKG